MEEYKYMILNENNIAESMATYQQPLLNVPSNYVKVDNDSMLWYKYENGQWGTESFAPTPQPTPITLEELQTNQLTIMNAIADLYSALPTTT